MGTKKHLGTAEKWRFAEDEGAVKDPIELQWEEYCSLWDWFEKPGTKTQLTFWREMSAGGRAGRISRMKEELRIGNASHFQREYESTHGEVW